MLHNNNIIIILLKDFKRNPYFHDLYYYMYKVSNQTLIIY